MDKINQTSLNIFDSCDEKQLVIKPFPNSALLFHQYIFRQIIVRSQLQFFP